MVGSKMTGTFFVLIFRGWSCRTVRSTAFFATSSGDARSLKNLLEEDQESSTRSFVPPGLEPDAQAAIGLGVFADEAVGIRQDDPRLVADEAGAVGVRDALVLEGDPFGLEGQPDLGLGVEGGDLGIVKAERRGVDGRWSQGRESRKFIGLGQLRPPDGVPDEASRAFPGQGPRSRRRPSSCP